MSMGEVVIVIVVVSGGDGNDGGGEVENRGGGNQGGGSGGGGSGLAHTRMHPARLREVGEATWENWRQKLLVIGAGKIFGTDRELENPVRPIRLSMLSVGLCDGWLSMLSVGLCVGWLSMLSVGLGVGCLSMLSVGLCDGWLSMLSCPCVPPCCPYAMCCHHLPCTHLARGMCTQMCKGRGRERVRCPWWLRSAALSYGLEARAPCPGLQKGFNSVPLCMSYGRGHAHA
eukprot:365688-Chlamydomonas_euryale.AAC.10